MNSNHITCDHADTLNNLGLANESLKIFDDAIKYYLKVNINLIIPLLNKIDYFNELF